MARIFNLKRLRQDTVNYESGLYDSLNFQYITWGWVWSKR